MLYKSTTKHTQFFFSIFFFFVILNNVLTVQGPLSYQTVKYYIESNRQYKMLYPQGTFGEN